ncbi:TetR/AcrR family transcriptional regulator [Streptomyces sp. NPDC051985]|uniref:TetR/AcrR family transcriptional regulator n=1 Tax=Streptomyces sp. NPDC051985 TaxID=3155807 RepID=UPI003443F21D
MTTRKRPSLQQQKRDFTRARLLDASLESFGEKGYLGATVDDIALAAGCSRATFYLHFKSRAEVIMALLQREAPDLAEALREFDDQLARGITRSEVRQRLEAGWKQLASMPGFLSALQMAVLTEPEVSEWLDSFQLSSVEGLEKFFATIPKKRHAEVKARMVTLNVLTLATYEMLARGQSGVTHKVAIDLLVDLWMNVFHPEAS